MTSVSVLHRLQESRCSVTLSVTELSERKLDFHLTNSADLRNESGEKYEYDTVRYFCGEGLSYARRRLGLDGGISVEIQELTGTVRAGAEVGVSLAIAVGIAKALGRNDHQALLENQDEWEATTTTP